MHDPRAQGLLVRRHVHRLRGGGRSRSRALLARHRRCAWDRATSRSLLGSVLAAARRDPGGAVARSIAGEPRRAGCTCGRSASSRSASSCSVLPAPAARPRGGARHRRCAVGAGEPRIEAARGRRRSPPCCARSRSGVRLRAAASAAGLAGALTWTCCTTSRIGFGVALSAQNLLYCFLGVLPRHRRRCAAGNRPGHHGGDAAADLVHAGAGIRDDPARRHLLRRAIWRLDHGDPDQHPRRIVIGRHHARRSRDGAARPRWPGARHSRHRLVLRRLRRDAADLLCRAAARRDRAPVRAPPSISR